MYSFLSSLFGKATPVAEKMADAKNVKKGGRRGRPKKSPSAASASPSLPAAAKRGRGRPRKDASAKIVPGKRVAKPAAKASVTTKKGPGRPRGSTKKKPILLRRRRPGRPSKKINCCED